MNPILQTSVFELYLLWSKIQGLMYNGVPTIEDIISFLKLSTHLANPKSASLQVQKNITKNTVLSISMLAGFKSLCIIPFFIKCVNPVKTSTKNLIASFSLKYFFFLRYLNLLSYLLIKITTITKFLNNIIIV